MHSERLIKLWKNRDELQVAEWDELYKLVCSILRKSYPSILQSLPESKENYIQDYFLHRVFEPAKRSSSCPYGANELCTYFHNYLIDVYRSASLRTTDYVESYEDLEGYCGQPMREEADSEFFEYKLTHQEVQQRASAFLSRLDEIGRIYLALNVCADASEPLFKLAEQYRIPSYHYRAHQLGITRKKGEFAEGYELTLIGQWLSEDLGLELISSDTAVLSALKILCLESLNQYQPKRSLR
jgi:hypothetical protein